MNKSISISLGGFAFFIEEEAYAVLKDYLNNIKNTLRYDDDKVEIINDVEIRIAELFKEYMGTFREVVTIADVKKVIAVLGTPEQINNEEIPENNENKKNQAKKLYRDTEDRIIGGVCSGLAHYIGLETVWMRLITLFLLFTLPFVAIIYIVLLFIVPKAKTVSEKLEMYGKPITFDTIKNWSEIEKAGSKIEKKIASATRLLGGGIKVIIGIVLILLGIVFLGLTLSFGFFNPLLETFPIEFYNSSWKHTVAVVLIYIMIGIPSIVFLVNGFRLVSTKSIFRLPTYVSTLLAIFWIIAIIAFINLSLFHSKFTKTKTVEKNISIELPNISSDTLIVSSVSAPYLIKHQNNFLGIPYNHHNLNTMGDSLVIGIKNELQIMQSPNNEYQLVLAYVTQIKAQEDANEAIEALQYRFKFINNELIFDTFLKTHQNKGFRDQDVRITLYVPNGKFIKNNNIDHFYFNRGNGYDDFWHQNQTLFQMENNQFSVVQQK
jgi:phage shock protein PspC (stress-responsive transcriptional regulator)